MALTSVTQEGVHRFALLCDSCDKPIQNASQANSAWLAQEGVQTAYTVHKGDCQRALAAKLGVGEDGLATDELAYLPTRLETVMGIDPEQARKGAAFLDRLRAIPSKRI
jgi:hypothetical protein